MNGKKEAMRDVMETGFALVELGEYLDTHPTCQSGLARYQQAKEAYRQAKEAYTSEYGPLCPEDVAPGSLWTWTSAPWPWETEV